MVHDLEAVSYGVWLKEGGILSLKKYESVRYVGDSSFVPICHFSVIELYSHILAWPHGGRNVLPCPWLWAHSCDLHWPISGCDVSRRLKKHWYGWPALWGSGHVPWEHASHSQCPCNLDPRMKMYRADLSPACSGEPNPAACSRAAQRNPAFISQLQTSEHENKSLLFVTQWVFSFIHFHSILKYKLSNVSVY